MPGRRKLIKEIAGCVNYWVSPDGQQFHAVGGHAQWAADYLKMPVPRDEPGSGFMGFQDRVYTRMFQNGWLRASKCDDDSLVIDGRMNQNQWDWAQEKALGDGLSVVDNRGRVLADYRREFAQT